jgi:hypothetical protein
VLGCLKELVARIPDRDLCRNGSDLLGPQAVLNRFIVWGAIHRLMTVSKKSNPSTAKKEPLFAGPSKDFMDYGN